MCMVDCGTSLDDALIYSMPANATGNVQGVPAHWDYPGYKVKTKKKKNWCTLDILKFSFWFECIFPVEIIVILVIHQ